MLWLFLALKIPIGLAGYLVWWAIRAKPEENEEPHGDGGQRTRPHPPAPLPRTPRRGPHGDPALPSPPRVRKVRAKSIRLPK
jgi:hypothetical protein